MNRGYLKLHRKISESSFFKNSTLVHLWIHLLIEATHQDYKIMFNGDEINLEAGQLFTGRKSIAAKTGIHESKIQRMLKKFEKFGMIEQECSNHNRVITICNWEDYQDDEKPLDQPEKKKKTKRTVKTISDRELEFKVLIKTYKEKYDIQMLKAFFEYWSEPDHSGKKMRFELESTWHLGRRLSRWQNRTGSAPQRSTNAPAPVYKFNAEESAKLNEEVMKRLRKAGHLKHVINGE
jgi:DNA-binding MarR family transcriptional regulator